MYYTDCSSCTDTTPGEQIALFCVTISIHDVGENKKTTYLTAETIDRLHEMLALMRTCTTRTYYFA